MANSLHAIPHSLAGSFAAHLGVHLWLLDHSAVWQFGDHLWSGIICGVGIICTESVKKEGKCVVKISFTFRMTGLSRSSILL